MKVEVLKNILQANDALAQQNRKLLADSGVFAVNLMGAPGCGKTTIIEKTIPLMAPALRMAVIEGDISSSIDAERLGGYDIPVVQINTDSIGGMCHLDAAMVRSALDSLNLAEIDLLMVENVGNLVCPAEFDIGQSINAMVSSVAEGHDKPMKYPLMFKVSDVLFLNKMDLLEHTDFDQGKFIEAVRNLNGKMRLFPVCAKTGEGLAEWCRWLKDEVAEWRRSARA